MYLAMVLLYSTTRSAFPYHESTLCDSVILYCWSCHALPEPAKVYNHLCRYSETHLLHALQLILRSIYFDLNVFLNKQLQV